MSSKRPATSNKLSNTDSQLAITAYGLDSITGNRDYGLFGAIAGMLTSSSADPLQGVPSRLKENSFDPALTAAIPQYDDCEPKIRMLLCLQNAVSDAVQHLLDKKLEDKKHLLLIVLPASVYARSEFINTTEWQQALSEKLPNFTNLHFHFFKADDNVTKHLQSACAALNEGKVESIIFAGSDSLLNHETCAELIEQNRLRSTTIFDGVVPGEAAASVVIQKVTNTETQTRAILKGFSFAPEPNSCKAHTSKMTGLSQVIQNVSQMAKQTPDDIECLIRNNSGEQHYAYEWYQTTQTIWPNKMPEQQRVAYQMGELDHPPRLKARKMPEELFTDISLGEVGAATIPISLVLGCARFDFNYPQVKNCLIMEANEFLHRGVILLENPALETITKA